MLPPFSWLIVGAVRDAGLADERGVGIVRGLVGGRRTEIARSVAALLHLDVLPLPTCSVAEVLKAPSAAEKSPAVAEPFCLIVASLPVPYWMRSRRVAVAVCSAELAAGIGGLLRRGDDVLLSPNCPVNEVLAPPTTATECRSDGLVGLR